MRAPMETLTEIPCQIRAGTSVEYSRTYADYPANDGWGLKLYIRGQSAPATIDGTASGAAFNFVLSAAYTAAIVPGFYTWEERATKGAQVKSAATGNLEVLIDLAAAGAGAAQSPKEKLLEQIRALIAGRALSDVDSYQIHGRQLTKMPLAELLKWEKQVAAEVAAERRGTPFQKHYISFGTPGMGQ